MSQILGVGGGKYLTFDRSWRDNGSDAQYALIGGNKVLIAAQTRALPEIFQRGGAFYYKDGTPIDVIEDVAYLPKKYRELAEKFIREQAGKVAPLKPTETKEEAVVQAVKRGRGRPAKVQPKTPVLIKDAQSFETLMGPDEAIKES